MNQPTLHRKRIKRAVVFFLLSLIILSSCLPLQKQIIPVTSADDFSIYIPLLQNGSLETPAPSTDIPLIHMPYKQTNDFPAENMPEMAVFWFGKVEINTNYYDVRIGYSDSALFVYIAAFDRLLWYDTTPTANELSNWDSVSLFLTPTNQNQLINDQSMRFDSGLAPNEIPRDQYQAAYRWNGSQWNRGNYSFTTFTSWRGVAMNDPNDDRGWSTGFKIPFSTFGINQKPANNTIWRIGIVANDRDYLNGDSIPAQQWPANFSSIQADNWSRISFGLLNQNHNNGTVEGTTIIREGLNNAVVQDASPGGFTICGGQMNFWTEWGTKVYQPTENYTANIQNQRDLADWPCYSKFFLEFPLSAIPAGKTVLNATLKLHMYGNAGKWGDPVFQPFRSLIQVSRTKEGWSEDSLNWNNAPQLLENISQTWVEPIEEFDGWPGVPYEWDITSAIQTALNHNDNFLSLALYSADGAYHSGKYFSTSEVEDWNATARPTLVIEYGSP